MTSNILNRKAKFEYSLFDNYKCGIVLVGTEVKSLRKGKASIEEAYCLIINDEVFIRNMSINENQDSMPHGERRDRKLLLNRKEIEKIKTSLIDTGMTLIPFSVEVGNIIKINISVAKGKKLYDKRQSIKKREVDRELSRTKREHN